VSGRRLVYIEGAIYSVTDRQWLRWVTAQARKEPWTSCPGRYMGQGINITDWRAAEFADEQARLCERCGEDLPTDKLMQAPGAACTCGLPYSHAIRAAESRARRAKETP
jgi:hypothetical protein